MKKLLGSIASIMLILFFFGGCTDKSPLDPQKPVTLTMWHNYGGDMQETMDYLVDQFNSTIGKDRGIIINVTAISSGSELNKSLTMIANGDPGAPDMPDIFTGYPKIAIQFQEKEMLVNLDSYFTADELGGYVDAFLQEGRLSDGGLYVFPIAKSTEILYLNQTLFDHFAEETGASIDLLSTFEGIAELSLQYYAWTDAMTPDTPNDGKQFFTSDSWFNVAEVGMVQLGESIFDENQKLDLDNPIFREIFETIFEPAVKGGIAIYDGYSSDLAKTGDVICSSGSSAGILFYGDTITRPDGVIKEVEYSILPYPVFGEGNKIALQRGGGLMVAKSTEQKEYAACEFIKWLTSSGQNMMFIEHTGYLPVTKQAFEKDMTSHLQQLEDERIRKMLTAVLSMYEEYTFFTAPNYSTLDADSSAFESKFKSLLTLQRNNYLSGEPVSFNAAFTGLQN